MSEEVGYSNSASAVHSKLMSACRATMPSQCAAKGNHAITMHSKNAGEGAADSNHAGTTFSKSGPAGQPCQSPQHAPLRDAQA
eukprot:1161277-Pelagomonas_calceolata.AAC.12